MIGKRSFLLWIVNWSVTSFLIPFGACLKSVSRWFLFIHPPRILLSFHRWLNIIFWNLGTGRKRDPNCSLLALRTELTILLGNDKLSSKNLLSGRGLRAWWSTVNTITGRDTQPQLISSVIHPDTINEYSYSINSDPEYVAPALIDIPNDARIPEIPLHVVTHFLSKLISTACGPDELPYWLFRDFAYDLAPAVTYVFNSSLRQHKVPSSWKMADIKPLPKESPLTSCTQLWAIIMRLFEQLVYRFELSSICNEYIDLDQFAYHEGHNSTMALIKCQHTWLKWLDGNANFVRIFSFDLGRP